MVTQKIRKFGLIGVIAAAGSAGCGGGSSPAERPAPTVSISPVEADATASATVPPGEAASFAESVLTETASGEQLPPPDRTLNGHSTGKLRVDVQRHWDLVRFSTPAGKKVRYTASVETVHGTFVLTMLPESAPNHVRNFVALARAGYYDGLVFEHVIQQEGDAGPATRLEMVEAGCPLGTGEPGIGHLGYWLRPEFSESVKHEEGTVGACHDDQADTAACRFYITLSPAPVMDGNFSVFAKVTQGLDVVRKIAVQPRANGSIRPVTPTVIRKVTIETREVDG